MDAIKMEESLIISCLQNEKLYYSLRDGLSKDFFNINKRYKRIFILLEEYISKTNTFPTQDTFEDYITKRFSDVPKDKVDIFLNTLKELYNKKITEDKDHERISPIIPMF